MRWQRLTASRGGYPFAAASVLVATLVLLPLRGLLTAPQFVLLFVPVIVAVARLSGVRVSASAAVLALVSLDFLFIPPRYILTEPGVGFRFLQ